MRSGMKACMQELGKEGLNESLVGKIDGPFTRTAEDGVKEESVCQSVEDIHFHWPCV